MVEPLRRFLGTNHVWRVGRTRKGYSVRLPTPGTRRPFQLITYIPDTTSRGAQLANAIAALPDAMRQLAKFHDLHFNDADVIPTARHKAGEWPESCDCCATLVRALEVQP